MAALRSAQGRATSQEGRGWLWREVSPQRLGAILNQLRDGRRVVRAPVFVFDWKVLVFDWKVPVFDWKVPVIDWRVPVFEVKCP